MRVSRGRRLLGAFPLVTGAAIVTHILTGVSLRLGVCFALALLAVAIAVSWLRTTPAARALVLRHTRVGLIAGLAGTATYDATRFALARLDPSPYDPYEAIRRFGVLLAGPSATRGLVYATGIAFHVANGVSFAVAYALMLGGSGVSAGIAWALGLEIVQLSLYPGWLEIRFYREFATISALSHVAYGAVLGHVCRRSLTGIGRAWLA